MNGLKTINGIPGAEGSTVKLVALTNYAPIAGELATSLGSASLPQPSAAIAHAIERLDRISKSDASERCHSPHHDDSATSLIARIMDEPPTLASMGAVMRYALGMSLSRDHQPLKSEQAALNAIASHPELAHQELLRHVSKSPYVPAQVWAIYREKAPAMFWEAAEAQVKGVTDRNLGPNSGSEILVEQVESYLAIHDYTRITNKQVHILAETLRRYADETGSAQVMTERAVACLGRAAAQSSPAGQLALGELVDFLISSSGSYTARKTTLGYLGASPDHGAKSAITRVALDRQDPLNNEAKRILSEKVALGIA